MANPLIFATNNNYKAEEVRRILKDRFELITLKEAGIYIDIPEPHNTLEENAREKSMTIYQLKEMDCFSEDTGLEVDELAGAPGVKSARYAGEHCSFEDNIKKLLMALEGKGNRQAQFRTVFSLIEQGKEMQFEGICEGTIALQPLGEGGFGYDPVFIPKGSLKSFGQMSVDEKNQFSHRRKALDSLLKYLLKKSNL
ncbi:MAG: RdgB/HAM1 family non-canonical purine NTP pyrophosphatase [Chitinophagaceae bacterium]